MSTTAGPSINSRAPAPTRHRNVSKASIVTPAPAIVEGPNTNESTMSLGANNNSNTNLNGHGINHNQHSSTLLPARTISNLRSAAIAHPQQQCVLTCYIPPSRVGAVIGRRGTTIIHVQREAVKKSWGHGGQVRVSIVSQGGSSGSIVGGAAVPTDGANSGSLDDVQAAAPSTEGNRDSDGEKKEREKLVDETTLWTPVIIRGDPCGAIAAAKLLLPLLTPASVHVDDNDSNEADYAADMDDVVFDVPIHRARHAAIIGKKGLTIAALSADHNVRIMVPHRNQSIHDKGPSSNSTAASPSNINIVQLEGQLDNVERCLASMLKVVCGTHSSNNASNDAVATDVADVKQEGTSNMKKINSLTHLEPVTSPENSDTSTKLSINITSNQNSNSKKEPKFLEQTITVPPELSYLVPSLAKIRSIGKSTSSVIRRKRVSGASSDNVTTSSTNGNAEEAPSQEKTESGDEVNTTSLFTTQLIVNGRTEFVKNAVAQLEKMLTPASIASDPSPERQHSKVNENTTEEKHDDFGKVEDNESASSSSKRKDVADTIVEHVRQKSGPGKRRPHGGRGGGRTGSKGGKKRGGGRGASGNRDGAVSTGGSNPKE